MVRRLERTLKDGDPVLGEVCVICLGDLELGDAVVRMGAACRHVLHAGCAREWWSRKASCPICCRRVVLDASPRRAASAMSPIASPTAGAARAAAPRPASTSSSPTPWSPTSVEMTVAGDYDV